MLTITTNLQDFFRQICRNLCPVALVKEVALYVHRPKSFKTDIFVAPSETETAYA